MTFFFLFFGSLFFSPFVVLFLFYPTPFSSLCKRRFSAHWCFSEMVFTFPLQLKFLLFWTEQESPLLFVPPPNCAPTHFCPFVVPDKADLLVQS